MSASATSSNPVVQAIVAGTAPKGAKMAAARGMLPLDQADMLEALVALRASDDESVKQAAEETLAAQEKDSLVPVASSAEAAPAVLGYLAARPDLGREIHEAVTLNVSTPDEAIALLAGMTTDGALLELITINQQRLIRAPAIIEAVIHNPARTPDAERRARETRREFFEKERGAQQIAEELRARGQEAAAEFIEAAESVTESVAEEAAAGPQAVFTLDDAWLIAQHIEVTDAEIDDSWKGVRLVDSAEEVAIEVAELLKRHSLARKNGKGAHGFFVTDAPERFIKVGQRFLGEKVESAVRIER